MINVIVICCVIFSYFLLARSFIRRTPPADRRFLSVCIFLAFAVQLALTLWVQYFYLQGDFLYGDSAAYHYAALDAIDYFKQGDFIITPDMIKMNYSGYSGYFLAPIYLLTGENSLAPKLIQVLLCLHIAIRIYDLLSSVLDRGRQAKMAFFFAVFFPEMIGQALYLRKDVLILWCIVNMFYYTMYIFQKGIQPKNVVCFALIMLYLSILRWPMAIMVFLACACYLLNRYQVPHRKLAYLTMLLVFVLMLKVQLVQQVDAVQQVYMQSVYAEDTLFAGASSAKDVVVTVMRNPVGCAIYAIKVLQGTFAGGLAPIRALFGDKEDFDEFSVDWIFDGVGAIWRYLNIIVTLAGLWIILRKYKTEFLSVLLFSFALMTILFVVGFSGRWGLSQMILCSLCWGIGFDFLFSKTGQFAAIQQKFLGRRPGLVINS
jgi:hypothetical protein